MPKEKYTENIKSHFTAKNNKLPLSILDAQTYK